MPDERTSALRERVRETRNALIVSALEQMSQPAAVFDRRYRLVCCNPAAIELLALPHDLARAGTPIREFILHQAAQGALTPDDAEARIRDVASMPYFRTEYQRHDGRIIMVRRDPLADGGFVVLFNDMTIQRGAEAALQRNERRYYAIVEDQLDLIVRFRPDGGITFANGACARFYGMRREELIGRQAFELVHPDDRDSVAAYFAAGRCPSTTTRTIEHRAPPVEGEPPRWLQRVDRVIRSATGDAIEFQSVLRDVSELKLAQEMAQRVGKLTTLGQIVAGVTHELNQPLNAAALTAQNALMDLAARDTVERGYIESKLEALVDDLQRMGRIVNHLRTFMRPSADPGTAADIAAAIRRSVELVSNQFDLDAIAFDLRLPATCRRAAAAPFDLETVLVNLFTNGRDAILRKRAGLGNAARPAAGRIVVTLRDLAPGPELRLTVRDNGGGIPEALIPRVFDPFVTTNEVGKGMGLGLSIVHQTVANLGGTLSVRNAHGGAEFCINVPAVETDR